MKSIEESAVNAMDGSDPELFQFLPYILQDIWEIGTDPSVVIEMVRKHSGNYPSLKVLDLGCGKGAVSVKLAAELQCSCLGIDAISGFVDYAGKKASEFGVEQLCRFETGDIRTRIRQLSGYDVIVLGAIGPVLGNYRETLSVLSGCLKENGIIIVDDGYIEDDSSFTHPAVDKRSVITDQIRKAGMQIIDEVVFPGNEMEESVDFIFRNLEKRCRELMEKHPEKKDLFENYIRQQEAENDVLETKVVCSVMVIQRI